MSSGSSGAIVLKLLMHASVLLEQDFELPRSQERGTHQFNMQQLMTASIIS